MNTGCRPPDSKEKTFSFWISYFTNTTLFLLPAITAENERGTMSPGVEQRTENPRPTVSYGRAYIGGSKEMIKIGGQRKLDREEYKITGAVAQLVEQRTENPCVGGSIPPHTTTLKPDHSGFFIGY